MAFGRNAARLMSSASEMTSIYDEDEYAPPPQTPPVRKRGRGADLLQQEEENARRHAAHMIGEIEAATINAETGQRVPPRTAALREMLKTVVPAPFVTEDAEKAATMDTHCVQYAYARTPAHEQMVEEFGEEDPGEFCFGCEGKHASMEGGDNTEGLVNIEKSFYDNFNSMTPRQNVIALYTIYETLIRKPVNDRINKFLTSEQRRAEEQGRIITPAQMKRIRAAMLPEWTHASIRAHFFTTKHNVTNIVVPALVVLSETIDEIASTSLFRKNVSTGQKIVCPQNIKAFSELCETHYKWTERFNQQKTANRDSGRGQQTGASMVSYGDNTHVQARKVQKLLDKYHA